MSHLLIVGGSDAGTSAALRAREVDPALEITLALVDRYPSFSVCGLPYYLSGEVAEAEALAHHVAGEFEQRAIAMRLEHRADTVDVASRRVEFTLAGGGSAEIEYDRLIVATGARPVVPRLPGVELRTVHVLRTIGDGLRIHAALDDARPGTAVIVGGGYLGVEMAEALTHRGLSVTLLEQAPSLLTTVDADLGLLVADELRRNGVTVQLGNAVATIEQRNKGLAVRSSSGDQFIADIVLVLVGVTPDTELAASAGAELGTTGAIRVNRRMETSLDGIYAAGDCVETWHRLLRRPCYLPLGSTAHKQGRIAGENAAAGDTEYAGSMATQVVKVFDLAIAGTGLREDSARAAGFEPLTVASRTWDRNPYYPGATVVEIRLLGDRRSGRLLGAQMLGHLTAQIPKRLDILAAALHTGVRIDDLNDLDLTYTPPFGRPWDPIQDAAQAWQREALR